MDDQVFIRLELENGTVLYYKADSYDDGLAFANRHFVSIPLDENWDYIDEMTDVENFLDNLKEDFNIERRIKQWQSQ